jgi:uncharacterized delta-60 repeat protein
MTTRTTSRALFESLESRQMFSAGTLDPTFGAGGVVAGIPGFMAGASAAQQDGKLILAGAWGQDIAVARVNANGTLDNRFGGTGMVTTHFDGRDFGSRVAIQPDGKIVVAGLGQVNSSGNGKFVVVRYNPGGTLDTSFDGDGKVSINFGSQSRFGDMAIQRDGKIVLVGSRINTHLFDETDNDFVVARLLPSGRLDQSFGSYDYFTHQRLGWTGIELGGHSDYARAVAIQWDGKIVVGGNALVNNSRRFAMARLKIDGSLDNTFDSDGRATTPFPDQVADAGVIMLNDLAIQTDGKLVAAGTADDCFALVRYNADGSLDTTFDGDGRVMTNLAQAGYEGIDSISALMITPQKRILAVGETARGDFAAARYLPGGALDTTFAAAGILKLNGMDKAVAVARAPEGKALITGTSGKTIRILETIPQVNLAGWDRSAAEAGADRGSFIVTRDGVYDFATRVSVTRAGTAAPGIDYAGAVATAAGYIDIPAGESFVLVELTPIDDAAVEAPETVQLTIQPRAQYTPGAHASGTVTIADNDGAASKPGPRAARESVASPFARSFANPFSTQRSRYVEPDWTEPVK